MDVQYPAIDPFYSNGYYLGGVRLTVIFEKVYIQRVKKNPW